MHSFTDNLGREWTVHVDFGAKKKILARKKINLFKVADNRFAVIEDLLGDQEAFFGVLWLLCETQAKTMTPPVADEAAFTALFGQVEIDGAEEALLEGLCDFLPSRHAESLRKLRAIGQEALTRLREMDPKQIVDEQMSAPPRSSTSSAANAPP